MAGNYKSGKRKRYQLGPSERERILEKGYSDWLTGRLSDRAELLRVTGDSRIHEIAGQYLDGDYQDDLVKHIEEQESLSASVRRRRMARIGLLPLEST